MSAYLHDTQMPHAFDCQKLFRLFFTAFGKNELDQFFFIFDSVVIDVKRYDCMLIISVFFLKYLFYWALT